MPTSVYAGESAVLATQHGKETVVAPPFLELLGLTVVPEKIDTDSFGTFAGEVPRTDTPANTALAKARAGMVASGQSLGLASEGTIGPDPFVPFVTSDIEIITFVDDERGIIVSETTRSTDIVAVRQTLTSEENLTQFLDKADFPDHGLIVRPPDPRQGSIIKGITQEDTLHAAVQDCLATYGAAVVESDLRAHYSPSRMKNIANCAHKLASRIAQTCPECASPGWGSLEPLRGLPCSYCGFDVPEAIRAEVSGCVVCPARDVKLRDIQQVEPRWCPRCNP